MKAYQLVLAVVCVSAVAAFYCLFTQRIDLAAYLTLVCGGGAVALLYCLQYNRSVEDAKYFNALIHRTTYLGVDGNLHNHAMKGYLVQDLGSVEGTRIYLQLVAQSYVGDVYKN